MGLLVKGTTGFCDYIHCQIYYKKKKKIKKQKDTHKNQIEGVFSGAKIGSFSQGNSDCIHCHVYMSSSLTMAKK